MPSFISKMESFFTVKGIVLFRLFFGYYYKLSDSPIICILTKLYCIICCGYSALYVFVLASKENSSVLYDGWLILEIAVNVFISLSNKDEFALNPAQHLPTLQLKQHVRATYSMIFISTFNTLYPVWTTWDKVSPFNDIRLTLILQSCYSARLAMVYSGENFAKILRELCHSVKDKLEKLDTTDDEKRGHVQEFLDAYVTITNYAAERNKIMRMKMCLSYVGDFFKLIVMMIYIGNVWDDWVLCIIEISVFFILLSVPPLYSELAVSYVDEIKKVFVGQLITTEDKKLRETIYDTLDYIDNCWHIYAIWNNFPQNIGLVSSFINICTTYIIALLQFSY